METINIKDCKYNQEAKQFNVSEMAVKFSTNYMIKNHKTGVSKQFNFVESTGPEFDPTTKWVYKSDCGLTLMVHNDAAMTEINKRNYAAAKHN